MLDCGIVLGGEARVLGPLLLTRPGQIHHLSRCLGRLFLLLQLLLFRLFLQALHVGDELPRGIIVDRADRDGLGRALSRGPLPRRQDVGIARSPDVQHHPRDQQELQVDEHGQPSPSAERGALPSLG